MTDHKTVHPNPELIARLHEACMPWLKHRHQSAFTFAQGEEAQMEHVLETPGNSQQVGQQPVANDYEPDKA
ncbi:hypothetical protein [Aurantiacibacter gilvus]|uniref:Uncharacterized protein n=1 Tax=Aurantiacibacter gilvus TaxID=3139141 RepID=A0ABU9IEF0_9SPHN